MKFLSYFSIYYSCYPYLITNYTKKMADNFYYDENWNLVEGTPPEEKEPTLDANGNELQNGDNVVAIKNLPVKGGVDIKKGDKFTNITLTDDPGLINAKSKKNGKMILKTEFFKKVG